MRPLELTIFSVILIGCVNEITADSGNLGGNDSVDVDRNNGGNGQGLRSGGDVYLDGSVSSGNGNGGMGTLTTYDCFPFHVCRPAIGPCDIAEICDSKGTCPPDEFQTLGWQPTNNECNGFTCQGDNPECFEICSGEEDECMPGYTCVFDDCVKEDGSE